MKDSIKILFVLVIAPCLYKTLILSSNPNVIKMDRKLNAASLLDSQISGEVKKISVEKIREEITDLHKNVKICIDEEFAKEPADILPFDEILRVCAGNNYAIVIRFYNSINFQIKEIVKEKVKGDLKSGFCDNILFMCIEFFRVLEMFMEKDYDVIQSIELNRPELERRIDEDRLNYMVRLTDREIRDYNNVRKDLIDERRFLAEYFTEQFNIYKERFGKDAYIRDDSLISDEHEQSNEDLYVPYSTHDHEEDHDEDRHEDYDEDHLHEVDDESHHKDNSHKDEEEERSHEDHDEDEEEERSHEEGQDEERSHEDHEEGQDEERSHEDHDEDQDEERSHEDHEEGQDEERSHEDHEEGQDEERSHEDNEEDQDEEQSPKDNEEDQDEERSPKENEEGQDEEQSPEDNSEGQEEEQSPKDNEEGQDEEQSPEDNEEGQDEDTNLGGDEENNNDENPEEQKDNDNPD